MAAEGMSDETIVAIAKALRAGTWAETAAAGLISSRLSALLSYAAKLTVRPADICPADVEALRSGGVTDLEILDLVQVTGYFAYANRIVAGLGVQLEAGRRYGD